MDIENKYKRHIVSYDAISFGKNLIGALLILGISLVMIRFLLLPDLMLLVENTIGSPQVMNLLYFSGSIFLMGFLVAFPIFLVVKTVTFYRNDQQSTRSDSTTK